MTKKISQTTIAAVREVPILELAMALGDPMRPVGKQVMIQCPDPSHGGHNAYIEPNRNIFKCFGDKNYGSCDCKGNNAITYYDWHEHGESNTKNFVKCVEGIANLMGIPIEYEDGSVTRSSTPRRSYTPVSMEKEEPAQSDEIVDRVYRAFLQLCPLQPHHQQELMMERGYTQEEIAFIGFRSVPTGEHALQILSTLKQHGYPLERIPGFTQRFLSYEFNNNYPDLVEKDAERSGYWIWTINAAQGYFIPVRDRYGRIVRLRVRRDKGEPKYLWFSSTENIKVEKSPAKFRKGGASSGAPLNIVPPSKLIQSWNPGTDLPQISNLDVLVSAEGEHKSFISAKKLGLPFVGVPGVGNVCVVLA